MEKFTYQKMSKNEDTFWWYIARRKIINKAIYGLKLKTNSILEVGSGTGGNAEFLEKLGSYTGIEKEPLAIKLSLQKSKESTFLQYDIPKELVNIEERFDLIVLLDVIEHIKDDIETIKKLKKLLTVSGTILITAPAHPFLWSYHDETHHHFRRYSKKAIKNLAIKNNLTIMYHSYFNFFLFPVIVVLRGYHKLRKDRNSDDIPVSQTINSILKWIFTLESKLVPRFKLPFGISHLIVLRKKITFTILPRYLGNKKVSNKAIYSISTLLINNPSFLESELSSFACCDAS